MAFRAPLLGYNTNVRHKGKLYHIQTEDSGVDHPHVITHLFADGGRIVATRKTSYADRVGSEGLPDIVKKLMQAQHKAIFIALRDGVYDEDDIADDMQAALLSDRPGDEPPTSPGSATVAANDDGEIEPQTLPPVKPLSPKAPTVSNMPRVPGPSTVGLPPVPASVTLERAGLYRATQAALSPGAAAPVVVRPQDLPRAAEAASSSSRSLFGSAKMDDRGLDEVILSYLAANDNE